MSIAYSLYKGRMVREGSIRMDPRVHQLRPTMFVDAVPELASARAPSIRTPADHTEAARSAEHLSARDGEDAEPLVGASLGHSGPANFSRCARVRPTALMLCPASVIALRQ